MEPTWCIRITHGSQNLWHYFRGPKQNLPPSPSLSLSFLWSFSVGCFKTPPLYISIRGDAEIRSWKSEKDRRLLSSISILFAFVFFFFFFIFSYVFEEIFSCHSRKHQSKGIIFTFRPFPLTFNRMGVGGFFFIPSFLPLLALVSLKLAFLHLSFLSLSLKFFIDCFFFFSGKRMDS